MACARLWISAAWALATAAQAAPLAWSPARPVDVRPAAVSRPVKPVCTLQQDPAAVARRPGHVVAVWWDASRGDLSDLVWAEHDRGAGGWTAVRPVWPGALGYWQDGAPVLARVANGALVMVWRAATAPAGPRKTLLSILNPGAAGWTRPEPFAPGDVRSISLAATPDGALHALYVPEAGGLSPLYSRRAPDGSWSPPTPLGDPVFHRLEALLARGYATAVHPVLAAAPDGGLLALWFDDRASFGLRGFRLAGRMYDPRWRIWGSTGAVAPQVFRDGEHDDLAAAGSKDGFQIAFTDDDHRLFLTGRPARAHGWSTPRELTPGLSGFEPALHAAADGTSLLTWRGGKDHDVIVGARWGRQGGSFTLLPAVEPAVEVFDHASGLEDDGRAFVLQTNATRVEGCLTIDFAEQP